MSLFIKVLQSTVIYFDNRVSIVLFVLVAIGNHPMISLNDSILNKYVQQSPNQNTKLL